MNVPIQYISSEKIFQTTNIRSLVHQLKLEYSNGFNDVNIPQRTSILRENPFAVFNAMPAFSDRHKLFVTKIGAVVPQSDPTLPSVHAIVVAFSSRTGKPLAIFDGDAITQLKCAAVTALVTDLCASPEAKVLALIGSGVQAREQIRGVKTIRQLEQIRIYSRNRERMLNFIRENTQLCGSTEVVACTSASEAVATADIISTTTTSADPVISAEALNNKFIHINYMGNHNTQSRELPLSVLQQSLLIVEDRATAVLEAGEVHRSAMTIEQLIKHDISNLQQQRTVFASTGHAFLDLVTVGYLLAALDINTKSND